MAKDKFIIVDSTGRIVTDGVSGAAQLSAEVSAKGGIGGQSFGIEDAVYGTYADNLKIDRYQYNPKSYRFRSDSVRGASAGDPRTEYLLSVTGGNISTGFTLGETVTQYQGAGGTVSAIVTIYDINNLQYSSITNSGDTNGYLVGVRNAGPSAGTASAGITSFIVAATAGNQLTGSSTGVTFEIASITTVINVQEHLKKVQSAELSAITTPDFSAIAYGGNTADLTPATLDTDLIDTWTYIKANHNTFATNESQYVNDVLLYRNDGYSMSVNAATGGSGGGTPCSELDELVSNYYTELNTFKAARQVIFDRYSATDGSLDSVYKINTISPIVDPETE
jgi:hypothetical protein